MRPPCLALALLAVSCVNRSMEDIANLDQPFTLAEGGRVKVLDTDLWVEAVEVIEGLEGTTEAGAGSAELLVDHGIEEDIIVLLQSGGWKTLGEYEVHLLEVRTDGQGTAWARLLVR